MDEEKERRILTELKSIYPRDLSIKEVSQHVRLSKPTTSTYLKVLEAQRKIEVSRRVGNAVFYRVKERRLSTLNASRR